MSPEWRSVPWAERLRRVITLDVLVSHQPPWDSTRPGPEAQGTEPPDRRQAGRRREDHHVALRPPPARAWSPLSGDSPFRTLASVRPGPVPTGWPGSPPRYCCHHHS
jgi:hypothetical protein